VTLPGIALNGGSVVGGIPGVHYQISNHRLELWGDFRVGQQLSINLRFIDYWEAGDRKSYRLNSDHGGMRLKILRPCHHIVMSIHPAWEMIAWIVSGIGLTFAVILLWRTAREAGAHSSSFP
jgi:hypothetical protein